MYSDTTVFFAPPQSGTDAFKLDPKHRIVRKIEHLFPLSCKFVVKSVYFLANNDQFTKLHH